MGGGGVGSGGVGEGLLLNFVAGTQRCNLTLSAVVTRKEEEQEGG